jgi:alpha-mannosidase
MEPGTPVHLMVVPHTHWDREWYQPFQAFRRRLVRLLDLLLDLLERDPAFSHFHLDGQTIVLEDYLEIRPDQRSRLRRLIRDGRIAVGPWYALPDEFLVSGESLIRNLLIGHRIASGFGAPTKIGYLPDQFGHIAQMPQILAGFEIDCAVVWRGVGADVSRSELLWEAPDGSRAFTVYLPGDGYSNGRNLPGDPARLRERLTALIAKHEPFRRTDTMLVMNGSDHQEPQPHLTRALPEAVSGLAGVTAEIAALATYVARARMATGGDLPVHRGELRSPLRAHLLPGVTSMRVRQKQRDFENVSRLERYAEPLATWADWLAGRRDLTAFTEWAWKLAIQNHPHDSICGCSVDQVHEDMEYRFDQVEAVGKQVLAQALATLAARIDTSAIAAETVLVVYNPNHATHTVVRAEIYHDQPSALGLRDAAGKPVPLQVTAGTSEMLLEAELPPDALRPHVLAIESREFLGFFINAIQFHRDADRLDVHLTADRIVRGRLDISAVRTRWLEHLDDTTVKTVRIWARTATLARLCFAADLAGHGLTCFALTNEDNPPSAPFVAGEYMLENRFYRVTVDPSDGSLTVLDKELGVELRRCNWFVDEGDRGDEYNFDRLLDPQTVAAPLQPPSVSIASRGIVAAQIRIRLQYALPAHLEADRETRSHEQVAVPIETTVTLYADVKRIDFCTAMQNHAKDHRLRVHFQTPVKSVSAHHEQAFAVVERSLQLEPAGSFEQPIGTVPQKTFTCVEHDGVGVAVLNRGIPEIEVTSGAEGVGLALTLMRAVGWLSRGDLRMRSGHAGPGLETPGAQSLGHHQFEYALTTYAGTHLSSNVVGCAHDFAYPPAATMTDRHAGDGTVPVLLTCDNPQVVVSAVTPSKHPQRLLVRCYNTSAAAQTTCLHVMRAVRARYVNFLEGARKKRLRGRDGEWQVTLAPAEIVTVQLSLDR